MKKIQDLKKGDVIAFFENGFNHVVAVIIDKPNKEGCSAKATSLTFGAEDVDYTFLPGDLKVAMWQSETPPVLA